MRGLDPVALRRIQYGALVAFGVALPIGKSLTEAALIIGLLALVLRTALGQRRPIIPASPLNLLLVVWFAIAICSMQNSVDLAASVQGLRKLLKWFGLYLLVLDTVDSPRRLRGVLGGCLTGLCLVSVDGIWQAVFGTDLFYGRAPHRFENVPRIIATFHHAAGLSIYLVSFCPLALALGLRGPQRVRLPLLALTGLAIAVLLLSWNRSGLLSMVCALAVLAFWMRHWAPALLALCAAAIQWVSVPADVRAWAATMPTWLHRLTEPLRLSIWQATAEMVMAHPIVGVGVNTFVKAYPPYRLPGDSFAEIGPYAHNHYLHLAAELGLVGLGVFLLLLTRVFLRVRGWLAQRPAPSFEAVASLGLAAGLIGYLVIGLLESALFPSRSSVVFWLLIGLLMAVDRMIPPPVSLNGTTNAP